MGFRGRAVQDQLAQEKREAAWREDRVRRLQLGGRPPADRSHALGAELIPTESRYRFERLSADKVVALGLAVPAPAGERHVVGPRPHERAEVKALEPSLLEELAPQSMLIGLPILDPAPGGRPDDSIAEIETDEENPVRLIDDDGARRTAEAQLTHVVRSCRSRNQRRRSSQGTAAFAGDVDGSTKSAASPILRS